jgi:broad specificity phosphatase PhoE
MAVSDKIGQVILYVLRHANVAADKKGTIRGTTNPSLDEKGRKQAGEAREFFKDIALSWIATDDLKRTEQTVLPIADEKQLEVEIDVELRSWDVGPDLENKSIEAKRDEIAKLKSQPWLIPVGGMSWADYEEQVDDALFGYTRRGMETLFPGLIGVHGSFIQVMAVKLGFMEKTVEYDQTPVEPSGIIGVYLTRLGLRMKILWGAKDVSEE